MIPIQSALVSYDDLVRQGQELSQALKDLEQAQKDLQIALDKGKEVTLLFNQAVSERNAAQAAETAERETRLKTQQALAASVTREKELQARILELTKPPVVVLPPTSPQKVTRAALGRWAGFTIEHGKKAPNATENGYARKAMDWGKSMGLDMYRIFLNPVEARAMAVMSDDNPEKLPAYGRKIGLRWMADTMDTIIGALKTHDELKAYCDALVKMGCEGFYLNDADRAAIPFDMLKEMIARLRLAAPDMPIFVSLLGSANVDLFKTVADYVEIQTFGTTGELATFLKKGAIPCLDLRKALTAADIKARVDIILRYPPQAFYFYADLVTDYVDAPDEEDAIVRDFLFKWKAMA